MKEEPTELDYAVDAMDSADWEEWELDNEYEYAIENGDAEYGTTIIMSLIKDLTYWKKRALKSEKDYEITHAGF